jgi:hypothetical protein
MANLSPHWAGISTEWLYLRLYPALLLEYCGGIASIASGKYGTLSHLLVEPIAHFKGSDSHAVEILYPEFVVFDEQTRNTLAANEAGRFPVSEHLFSILREALRQTVPDDRRYRQCAERFEYFLGGLHADLRHSRNEQVTGPMGAFATSYVHQLDPRSYVPNKIMKELRDQKDDWPPLKAGLFGGSLAKCGTVLSQYNEYVEARLR